MSYMVLLCTAEETTSGRLRAQIAELPDIHLSSVLAGSSSVVPYLADNGGIDCLLLDESFGPLPPAELIREVTGRYPHVAVIMLVAEATAGVLGSAMEAGARGVLVAKPSLEDLETKISGVAEWSRTMRRHIEGYSTEQSMAGTTGRIVVVAGSKGGTGTTTLAVHLALAATSARRSVCLVDMDLQAGDVPTYLDITHRRSIVDLAEAADEISGTVLADTLFAHRAGPHVLLAPRDGERAEDVSSTATRQLLGSLRSRYDLVIVDCGAYVTDAAAMATEIADFAVITVTPDMPALRGARRLVEMWERLQVRKRDDLAVVVNRHHRQSEIQPDFVRKVLGFRVLTATVPSVFRGLESAANTGTPSEVENPAFRKAMGRMLREIGALQGPPHGAVQTVNVPAPAPAGKGKRKKKTRPRQAGQATIEFVAMLPFIAILVIVLWESLLLGMAMMTASHAANEGARAAAVGLAPDKVRERAHERMPGDWSKRSTIDYREGDDKVTVSLRVPVLMPRIEAPWHMTASAEVVHE
ncbi:MAG: AAA family ATPase [Streptosporangiales bacterium]|nr:AAA family ATPase [Streptosporangiales bacterium]